jgi:hypothetical protein
MIKFFKKQENELLWSLAARLLRLLFLNKDIGDFFLEKYGKDLKDNKLVEILSTISRSNKNEESLRKEVCII